MTGAIRFRVFTGERPLAVNRNKHWTDRHRNTETWQQATYDALKEAAIRTQYDRVGFRFHPYYPGGNLPDADGLAPTYKAIVDACVKHGMVADDNPPHVAYKHFAAPQIDNRLEWPVMLVIVIPKAPVGGHGMGECDCETRRETAELKAAVKRAAS